MTSPIPPVQRRGAARGEARARVASSSSRGSRCSSVRRLRQEQFAGEGGALLLTGNAMHSRRRARRRHRAASSAGCSPASGSSTASRCPKVGRASSPPRWCGGSSARGGIVRCYAPVDADRGARSARGGGRARRRRRRSTRRAACSPTSARPRCTATSWARSTCRARFVRRPRPVPVRPGHVQGRLGALGTDPVARRGGDARGHGARRATAWTASRRYAADLAQDRIPAQPFVLLGQMNKADPTRSPPGTETVWAYTHVPLQPRGDAGGDLTGKWDAAEAEAFADRIEAEIEEHAPGLPRAGHRSARPQPARAGGARRQPRRGRARRRHDGVLPTARVPPGSRARSGRDPDPRPVPGVGVGPPRRRRPRRVARTRPRPPRRRPDPAPRAPVGCTYSLDTSEAHDG